MTHNPDCERVSTGVCKCTNRAAQIAEIRERESKATKGPWRLGSPSFRCKLNCRPHGQGKCAYTFDGWTDYAGQISADNGPMLADEEVMIAGTWDYEYGGIKRDEDRVFIAHAREDIPFLLGELDRVEAERDSMERRARAFQAGSINIQAENAKLRGALTACEARFTQYNHIHQSKGAHEKAASNFAMALKCRAALEQSKGGESANLHGSGTPAVPLVADRSPSSSDVFADCRKCNCRYDRLLVHICLADVPSSDEKCFACNNTGRMWIERRDRHVPCTHCGTGKAKP